MQTMHAIRVQQDNDRSLILEEVQRPEPEPYEVLVRVKASGVNRADLIQRAGHYPPPAGASNILGLEVSGRIEKLGSKANTTLEVGDTCVALLSGGGYAEYVTCPAQVVLPCPQGYSMIESAALPEVYATAWLNIFMEGGAQPGETVLLHAAGSGVGTAAIQLCTQFGLKSMGTASGAKLNRLKKLGLSVGIDRHTEDFLERIKTETQGKGVDLILDPVGGAYFERNVLALAPQGRLVNIGLLDGAKGELSIGRLLVKRLRIIGSVLRSRSTQEKIKIMNQLHEHVWPLLEQRRLNPIIERTYTLKDAQQAHELLKSNTTMGKIILTV